MLDQRIAGQGTDHIDARNSALERLGQGGEGFPIRAGEGHAHRLDELARGSRSHAGNDPVTADGGWPFGRLDRHEAGRQQPGRRPRQDGNATRVAGLHQRLDVRLLGPGKVHGLVQQGDHISLGGIGDQAQCVLDARVTATHDHDVLVNILGRIIERVLDVGHIRPGNGQSVGIALGSDGEDDGLGSQGLAVGEGDLEVAPLACDRRCLGVVADVHAALADLVVPAIENHFAPAGLEGNVGAQDQLGRRGHDVLAALIAEDGVRKPIGLFQQDMVHPAHSRACGRAQPGRARSQDGDLVNSPHDPLDHTRPPARFVTALPITPVGPNVYARKGRGSRDHER